MSVIGDFVVPAGDFALERALEIESGMTVEADRLASHSTMEVLPFVWVTGSDADAVRDAFAADPTVESITVADVLDDEVLCRVTWSEVVCDRIDDMVDHHAAIVRAEASDGEWSLRLRFAERGLVSTFQSHFSETGDGVRVRSLSTPSSPRQTVFGLTAGQREALTAAVRSGYFAIPRTTSAEELGAELGISANAASERIRRGTETLIESGLMLGDASER